MLELVEGQEDYGIRRDVLSSLLIQACLTKGEGGEGGGGWGAT